MRGFTRGMQARIHTRAERGYLLDDVRERKEHAATEAWLLLRRSTGTTYESVKSMLHQKLGYF